MLLTVVVENFCQNQNLKSEWGYSLHLKNETTDLLLDTGGYQHALEHNAKYLDLDWKALKDVVLSHSHFDHTAGLMDVVRMAPQATIWGGAGFEKQRWSDADHARNGGGGAVMASVIDRTINPWVEVTQDVIAFTVPQSERNPIFVNARDMWEETPNGDIIPDTFTDDVSLLVHGERGYSVVLGCAHAGLPNILAYAQKTFGIDSFDTVLGGTHLCSVPDSELDAWMEILKSFNVKRWRPNHCTGFHAAARLAQTFDDVQWGGCGTRIKL